MCNFIMMGILLVTAYNGMWWQGRRHGYSQDYTQGYSKYSRRPRVRTVRPASLPASPSRPDGGRGILKQIAARTT